jgi:translation initiation factor IF-1
MFRSDPGEELNRDLSNSTHGDFGKPQEAASKAKGISKPDVIHSLIAVTMPLLDIRSESYGITH